MKNQTAKIWRCENCGGSDFGFDETVGKLKCRKCRMHIELQKTNDFEDLSKLHGVVISKKSGDLIPNNEAVTLHCSSCGAEVMVAANEDGLIKCPWCRHELSVDDSVSNSATPDLILPFRIKKSDAYEKIKQYIKKKKIFADGEIIRTFKEENVRAIYLPYLIVDANMHVSADGKGRKVVATNLDTSDATVLYDVDVYELEREIDLYINDLPLIASAKYDDSTTTAATNNIISSILPFDTENAVDWDARLLKGFSAEKRNVGAESMRSNAKKQLMEIAKQQLRNSANEYDKDLWSNCKIEQRGIHWKTIYLPVWLYGYYVKKDKNKILRYIAVNARSGKTIGNIFESKKKEWGLAIGVPLALMALIVVLFLLPDLDSDWAGGLIGALIVVILVWWALVLFWMDRVSEKYTQKQSVYDYVSKTDVSLNKRKSTDDYIRKDSNVMFIGHEGIVGKIEWLEEK